MAQLDKAPTDSDQKKMNDKGASTIGEARIIELLEQIEINTRK
jgi:hypothetical protein